MKAGFAKVQITPPIGTTMMGFASRDRDHGCEAIHDDLFVRALFLTHAKSNAVRRSRPLSFARLRLTADEEVLIMGFDLCFLGREDADRYKGAIGRKIDLAPRRILLNTSHTHVGPSVGTWAYADYTPPDRLYLRELERAVVNAACQAQESTREVTLWAGATRSALPMSRRKKDEKGKVFWAPNPDGVVCDTLPICLFKDLAGTPVCLLFSVSCHPSTISGYEISAEYPGVAMNQIDANIGAVASLFLQGAGGDAKPSVIGKDEKRWRVGNWGDVTQAGTMVANEVIQALETGLTQLEPEISAHALEMEWPLASAIGKSGYEAILKNSRTNELMRLWAERQTVRIDRSEQLPTSVPITAHGVQIGKGLRLIGLEGEAVAGLGLLIQDFYKQGITFPLGYTNGAQLYLPTESMLDEGGYEVESYYEYGQPAPLAQGFENILIQTLRQLRC